MIPSPAARLGAWLLWVMLALAPALPALMLGAPPVLAQVEVTQEDYAAWEEVAQRAETAVAEARASSDALEALRSELVEWRARFASAQNVNSAAIETVKSQIATLGTLAEGETESEETAALRTELNRKLTELQAPVKTAEIAYTRADGLIRNIDQIIRDRQASALIELKPSPLNPATWPDAWAALSGTVSTIRVEIAEALSNPARREQARSNLPAVLALLAFALVVLVRGRGWMELLAQRVEARGATAGRWLSGFVLSLGQIAVPVIGLVALSQALRLTGLAGLRGEGLLVALPLVGFGLFSAIWLGGRMFPRSEVFAPPLVLSAEQRREGRLYAGLLGLLMAIHALLRLLAERDDWSDGAVVVVNFPILVLIGVMLLRLGQLLLIHARAEQDEEEATSYRARATSLLARALMVVAVVGPLLAAAGYFEAGRYLMMPTVLTLQLIAFAIVLHRLICEIYVLVSGDRDALNTSLVPVMVAALLILAALPVLALIWGARLADLSEVWTRFTAGFSVGGVEISPAIFVTLLLVFVIGFTLTRLLQSTLRGTVLPKTKIDIGGQNAIISGVGYVGIFLAALVAITSAGIDLSSLAIVAGALSVGIGFGLQNIVSNFVSGIILLIERPISEGDWIEVGGQMGYVRDISVRSTRIETFDRTDVIVPNADLVSGTVTNYTRGNTVGRVIAPVGVAYGTDTRKVEAILRDIAEAHPMVVVKPPPAVLFQGFGADSLDFEIRAILRDVNWVASVKSDLNHEIARRFAEEGIEIPFAQRDVWLRNPEALGGAGSGEKSGDGNGGDARTGTAPEPPASASPAPEPAPAPAPPEIDDMPDGESR